jgi:uncharacterized protein with HEPN domain
MPDSMMFDKICLIPETIRIIEKYSEFVTSAFNEIISHQYENSDTDIVFQICTQYIPILKIKVEELLNSSL